MYKWQRGYGVTGDEIFKRRYPVRERFREADYTIVSSLSHFRVAFCRPKVKEVRWIQSSSVFLPRRLFRSQAQTFLRSDIDISAVYSRHWSISPWKFLPGALPCMRTSIPRKERKTEGVDRVLDVAAG